MKAFVWTLLTSVFVNTATAVNPKQVNLALETVLKFDKQDQSANLDVIDKIHNVLEKIKDAMQSRSGRRHNSNDLKFTDFVLQAARTLIEYNDNDLEDAFAVTNEELRRYINAESKLQELFGNNHIRRYVSEQLDYFVDMPAEKIRSHLDNAIVAIENNGRSGDFYSLLDLGNTLYIGAGNKLKMALENLDKLRRSNDDFLGNLLGSTLRSLIFDHYSSLNDSIKGELGSMVKYFWDSFSKKGNKDTDKKSSSPNRNKTTRPFSKRKVTPKRQTPKFTPKIKISAKVTPKRHTIKPVPNRYTTKNAAHSKYYTGRLKGSKNKKHNRPKNLNKTKVLSEIFLTSNDLKKLGNYAKLAADLEKKKNPGSVFGSLFGSHGKFKLKNKTHNYLKKPKSKKNKILPKLRYKLGLREGSEIVESDSKASEMITGGRAIKDFHLRVDASDKSSENSDKIDNMEKSEEEDTGHFSYRDNSAEAPTKARSFISLEGYRKFDSGNSEEDLNKSKWPTENRKTEGISIESFEDAKRIIRKSNNNDTFNLEMPKAPAIEDKQAEDTEEQYNFSPNNSAEIKKLIDRIEKEIEEMKGEVQYVKTLKKMSDLVKPKFKTVSSDETPSDKLAKAKNADNSASLDKENYEFLSDVSNDKLISSNKGKLDFGSHENLDKSKSSEIETNPTDTKTTVTEKATIDTADKATHSDVNSKENSSVNVKDSKNSDEIHKTELLSINDGTHDDPKSDDRQDNTTAVERNNDKVVGSTISIGTLLSSNFTAKLVL